MIAAISRFEIQNGLEKDVKDAFRNRPGFVQHAKEFVRLDVLSPLSNPAENVKAKNKESTSSPNYYSLDRRCIVEHIDTMNRQGYGLVGTFSVRKPQ